MGIICFSVFLFCVEFVFVHNRDVVFGLFACLPRSEMSSLRHGGFCALWPQVLGLYLEIFSTVVNVVVFSMISGLAVDVTVVNVTVMLLHD